MRLRKYDKALNGFIFCYIGTEYLFISFIRTRVCVWINRLTRLYNRFRIPTAVWNFIVFCPSPRCYHIRLSRTWGPCSAGPALCPGTAVCPPSLRRWYSGAVWRRLSPIASNYTTSSLEAKTARLKSCRFCHKNIYIYSKKTRHSTQRASEGYLASIRDWLYNILAYLYNI